MYEQVPLVSPRRHGIGRGWVWVRQGFDLFNRGSGVSVLMVLIWFLVGALLDLLPAGNILANLLYMVWMAGWMAAAGRAWHEGRIRLEDLFAGFRQQLTPLILASLAMIGGVTAIVLLVITLLGGWSAFEPLMQAGEASTLTPDEVFTLFLGIGLVATLMVPVLMATTFAPALIFFHRVPVLTAFRLSMLGCWRNMWPFLLWGLLAFGLILLGALLLLVGLLVMLPALNYSAYAAYRDIFLDSEGASGEPMVEPSTHLDA